MSFISKLVSSSSLLALRVKSAPVVRNPIQFRRSVSTTVARRQNGNGQVQQLSAVPARWNSAIPQSGNTTTAADKDRQMNMMMGVGFFGVLMGFVYMFYESEDDEQEIERRKREQSTKN